MISKKAIAAAAAFGLAGSPAWAQAVPARWSLPAVEAPGIGAAALSGGRLATPSIVSAAANRPAVLWAGAGRDFGPRASDPSPGGIAGNFMPGFRAAPRIAAAVDRGAAGGFAGLLGRLGALMDGSARAPASVISPPVQASAPLDPSKASRFAPRAASVGSSGGAPGFVARDSRPVAGIREAVFVGNNWAGTVDIIDAATRRRIKRIDVVPDRAERTPKFWSSPKRWLYFRLIRRLVGEGHDQLVDDMIPSKDGRVLFVSRPSYADVVAVDLKSGKMLWRAPVAGYRADHAALSPDGKTLLISASTARKVQAIDTATGRVTGEFESGDQPHEIVFSDDGRLIFHASIGRVFIRSTSPRLDRFKGDRWFQVVDARTLEVLKRIDMGKKLAEFGIPGIDSAVRPMAVAPDGRFVYLQLSFFHGFVEYDLLEDKVTRVARLPISETGRGIPTNKYVNNSAHHGIAINPEGTKIAVAATVSDYAAIVDRETFEYKVIPIGKRPYWVTVGPDGDFAYFSVSGSDEVVVVSFAEGKIIERIAVGSHPQRVRLGKVRLDTPR